MKFMAIVLEHDLSHLKCIRKQRKQQRKQPHVKFGVAYSANNRVGNFLSWIPPFIIKK